MAYSMMSESPYNFAFGNPVTFNDPLGDRPREVMLDLERYGGGGGGPTMYDWSDNWTQGFGPHEYGQHRIGPGSGNYWSDQYSGGFGMSAGDFINSALRSENGGSWSNGSYHYYTSSEARDVASSYYFESYSYLDYSTANSNTAPTTVLGWRILSRGQYGGCPPGVDCNFVNNAAQSGLNWYGPGGQINWLIAASAAAGENVSGAARLGSNFRVYVPSGGYVFQAGTRSGRLINTFSISKAFNFLGKVSFGAAFTMDVIGVGAYYQDPNSPNAVHPGKFAANTGVGLFGLTGVGTVPSLLYFGIDSFYPGGIQGYSQMLGNHYNSLHGTSGEKVIISTFH